MKNLLFIALLISSLTFAQNSTPELEINGKQVQAVYYHANGAVQQTGHFLNGKLEGKWVSYNENGVKIAIAEYAKGEKVGNWFFWNNEGLSEVDFSKDSILSVKKWSNGTVALN